MKSWFKAAFARNRWNPDLNQISHIVGPEVRLSGGFPASLGDAVGSRINQFPNGRYIEVDQSGRQTSVGYVALHRRALEILSYLRQNASNADAIVLCFESSLDFIPATWASILGGFNCVPVQVSRNKKNDHNILATLKLLTKKLDAPLFLTTSELKKTVADGIVKSDGKLIVVETIPRLASFEFQQLRASVEASKEKTDGGFLVLTSGTDSEPKLVEIKFSALLSRFALRRHQPPFIRSINLFPFDSVTGLWIILPTSNQEIYFQPDRMATHPLDLLSISGKYQVEALTVTSSLAAMIIDAARSKSEQFNLHTIKSIGFGAERINPLVVKEFLKLLESMGSNLGSIKFGYGMTETGPICGLHMSSATQLISHIDHGPQTVALGGCLPGWSLRVVDDNDTPAPEGIAGHMQVWSADKLFSGYYKEKVATKQCFTKDGWFKTGDIGVIEAGLLRITGRERETIIINAKNFSLEQVEAPLRDLDGIWQSAVIAASVRGEGGSGDELALFFIPHSTEVEFLDDLCAQMIRQTARCAGISVKHLIPIKETDIKRTRTGKLRRRDLVERYHKGTLKPYIVKSLSRQKNSGKTIDTDIEAYLGELWRDVLKLGHAPQPDENFYDIGGDSLASAIMITALEGRFQCRIPVGSFFKRPTIATLADLIKAEEHSFRSPTGLGAGNGAYDLLHKIESYAASWRGTRLFGDSLVVGANVKGKKPPIFWVFQEQDEYLQLAKHLGPDQPLYAMRSCVKLVKPKEYTQEILETVCNRYLWEILALSVADPVILGGNCQGAIIALALARRLRQINRPPSKLILMEWSYSYGKYDGPVLLIYGKESYTAEIYTDRQSSGPDWQGDFPDHHLLSIPGAHGAFFQEENIGELAASIAEIKTVKIPD